MWSCFISDEEICGKKEVSLPHFTPHYPLEEELKIVRAELVQYFVYRGMNIRRMSHVAWSGAGYIFPPILLVS
jgi:hypothetical protein